MPQVVIVSNRLPVSVSKENGKLKFSPSVGGLATGLSSFVNDKHSIWIGWPGIASDDLTDKERKQITVELARRHCSPVFLTKNQIDDFYSGYSNTVLWPLFHGMRSQDKPGAERNRWYKSYKTVNELFAEAVESATLSGAQIWVHDYQLLLVPEMLRANNVDVTIGFFLHIPFPQPKKFMSLEHHKSILIGMAGSDLIGFHTPDYVDNFIKTCNQSRVGKSKDSTLVVGGRTIRVADFPMGIDYEKYASAHKSKTVQTAVDKYRRKYSGKKVIVAVDRLDPSKGLPERVKAYGNFLEQYPRFRKKVVFSMVAAPSRTDVPAYQRLAKRLDKLVADVNNTYGTKSWQPIDYINVSVPFEEVTALFHIADVAFIAPLRDGMNLAAKEFIASTHKDSILILSETAGASQELKDALIVNPHKPETVVNALHDSLTMNRAELRRRLKRMKRHLRNNNVQKWAATFVTTLQKPLPKSSPLTYKLTPTLTDKILASYASGKRRLLLLDYDGTLVPFHDDYRKAAPSKSLLKRLETLGKDPANDVVIISGRDADNLSKWFGHLPLHLVAEHGAATKFAGSDTWHQDMPDKSWKEILLPVLEKYAAMTPGAKVESKEHSLVWHYRSSSPYYAQKHLVIIQHALKPFLKSYGLQALKGNKVLEIKRRGIDKGKAARTWLDRSYDFVLGVGDDTTDEKLFEAMNGNSYSIKIGRSITAARYRVHSHTDILRLLDKL